MHYTEQGEITWYDCGGSTPSDTSNDPSGGSLPYFRTQGDQLSSFSISPNPAQDIATVQFSLEEENNVSLEIFDINGRKVKTILSEKMNVGEQSHQVDLSDLDSGIYYLHIRTGKKIVTRKVVKM